MFWLKVVDNKQERLLTSKSDRLIIIGYGINIIKIKRVKEFLERSGEHFETQCFTIAERSTSESGASRIQYLAGRFAAKQAVLKALGMKWSQEISWLDIEVQRLPTGEPSVALYARCKELAVGLGITKWLLSISHVPSYATASVIALGSQQFSDQ